MEFDCCTYFIATIDLCCFHSSHILWRLSWYYNFYFALFRSTTSGNAKSSHRRCSVRRVVFRNFAKFTGKHLCQRLWHKYFPLNFAKFLRTPFLQKTPRRLLLKCLNKKIRKRKWWTKLLFWKSNCLMF